MKFINVDFEPPVWQSWYTVSWEADLEPANCFTLILNMDVVQVYEMFLLLCNYLCFQRKINFKTSNENKMSIEGISAK